MTTVSIQSTELNSILGGEFEDILDGNSGWPSWSNRIVLCRNGYLIAGAMSELARPLNMVN
jgi:hypothetical protein